MKKRIFVLLVLAIVSILAITAGILATNPISTPVSKTLHGTARATGSSDPALQIEVPVEGAYRHFFFGNDLDYFEGKVWAEEHHAATFRAHDPWAITSTPLGTIILNQELDCVAIACYLDENGEPLEGKDRENGTLHLILASADPSATEASLTLQIQDALQAHPQWDFPWDFAA